MYKSCLYEGNEQLEEMEKIVSSMSTPCATRRYYYCDSQIYPIYYSPNSITYAASLCTR